MNKFRTSQNLLLLTLGILTACLNTTTNSSNYNSAEEWVLDVKRGITEMEVRTLKELQNQGKPFLLIDVRTSEEHDIGYIPGSVLIPRGLIEFRIANTDFWDDEGLYDPQKDDVIVLYCRSGNRSALASAALKKLGYKNVYSLEGGFNSWREAHPENIEVNLPQVNPNQIGPVAVDDQAGSC